MHFSALVVSMLATNAAAWRHRHGGFTPGASFGTPTFGHGFETPVQTPGNFPEETPGGDFPAETPIFTPVESSVEVIETSVEADVASPTTFVTRKVSSSTTAAAVVATTSASSSSSSLTTDQQNALDAHNAARSAVGTADLTWDADLAADAQTWATHLVSVGSLTHSSVEDQGENLYMQYGTDTPYTNAVAAFVAEKSEYNGEAITSTNYLTFGHYTQVVWKDTTKVGMAIASGSNGETYVVARYSPPGNYLGETAY